jgi:hypothetical protein
MKTYESTITKNGILYGQWHEDFRDEDTGRIASILRGEPIADGVIMPKIKKKQSRLHKDKWAFYVFDERTDEFPRLLYYLKKKNKKCKN